MGGPPAARRAVGPALFTLPRSSFVFRLPSRAARVGTRLAFATPQLPATESEVCQVSSLSRPRVRPVPRDATPHSRLDASRGSRPGERNFRFRKGKRKDFASNLDRKIAMGYVAKRENATRAGLRRYQRPGGCRRFRHGLVCTDRPRPLYASAADYKSTRLTDTTASPITRLYTCSVVHF